MTRKTGDDGERIARKYLRKEGFRVLEQNYRALRGEIDIIAEETGVLVFVEVKTNSGPGAIAPELRVNTAKQRQIGKIAQAYLQKSGRTGMDCRFDVVGVTMQPDGRHDITHIRDAFWLPRNM